MKTVWLAFWIRKVSVLGLLLAVATLSGCGGSGGGGGGTPAPTQYLLGGTIQGVALNLTGTPSIFAGATGATYPFSFNQPHGIATDGTYLYVADPLNNQLVQFNIATGANVALTNALFNHPSGITTQDGKTLYVANIAGRTILKIEISASDFSNATVSVLAGDGTTAIKDGTGASAEFQSPWMLTTDGTYLYVTDADTIRRVEIASGVVQTLPFSGLNGLSIVVVGSGNNATLYFTDYNSNLIKQIHNPSSADLTKITLSTFCGTGTYGWTSGSCNGTAEFYGPDGLTTDGTYLYVSDDDSTPDIRRIDIAKGQVDSPLFGYGSSNAAQVSITSNLPGLATDGIHLYATDGGDNKLFEIN